MQPKLALFTGRIYFASAGKAGASAEKQVRILARSACKDQEIGTVVDKNHGSR